MGYMDCGPYLLTVLISRRLETMLCNYPEEPPPPSFAGQKSWLFLSLTHYLVGKYVESDLIGKWGFNRARMRC